MGEGVSAIDPLSTLAAASGKARQRMAARPYPLMRGRKAVVRRTGQAATIVRSFAAQSHPMLLAIRVETIGPDDWPLRIVFQSDVDL